MQLIDTINADLKQAMLNKDEASLRGIRAIKSAILIAQSEKGASKELDNATEIKMLQKLIKQRKDALEIYQKEKRDDLAKKETEEIAVIEKYLPQQMTSDELRSELKKIIELNEVKSAQEMGKIIGLANKQFAGKADGKTISAMVKELLS